MQNKNFYITTAIAYVNGKPHLGHGYEAISTDIIARHKRLDGYAVHFLTGTDEHGQKVEKTAIKNNMEVLDFCNLNANSFKDMDKSLNISNDDFIRTTEARHKNASKALWLKLLAKGDIYLGSYSGWYSVRDEGFFGEDELTKGQDGKYLAPTGAEVEWIEEPSYFFKLSAYQDKLLKLYEDTPDFIMPTSRKNEVINFVKKGLTDLSISRTSFKWGIDVPDDEKHIMYVWLDALTNYITALGYPDENSELFTKFWPADLHIIGKDILRFHAIYWPAFLMSADLELPKRIFGHGFLFVEGEKMSKSLGNVIAPQDLVDKYGLDQTRYFLLREVPFGNDGSFSHEKFIQRINSDLANDLGNLVQRVFSMIAKNCDGKTPTYNNLTDDDNEIIQKAKSCYDLVNKEMDALAISKALSVIWEVIGDANRFVDKMAPWNLRKTDINRMNTVLFVLAEVIRIIGIYVLMIMPDAGNKILDIAGIDESKRKYANIFDDSLTVGKKLPAPSPIFPRYIKEND